LAEVLVSLDSSSLREQRLDLLWIKHQLERVLQLVGGEFRTVNLRLVGDAAMVRLHGQHCGDPSTTDVLTFVHACVDELEGAYSAAPDDRTTVGTSLTVDLVLCVDEAGRQAARRGHLIERELLLYAVHGVLHCIGHDDATASASEAMHAEEDRLLSAIGVGRTYARDESATPGEQP